MPDVIVDSTASLASALHSVQDGDRILLQPGVYDGLNYVFNNLSFIRGITITSADPANPATLTHFDIQHSNGLSFAGLTMVTQAKGYFDFQVLDSSNVHFDHVSVHGTLDGNPQNDIEGLRFEGSSNISVTNSEFQQLERAMAIGSGDHIVVSGNYVHDVEVTGVMFAQVGHVTVSGNTFSNFRPVVGVDHPDAIQFLTSGTTAPSHDISVTDNLIYRGTGEATQGIFFRDQLTTMHYQNVTIANNLIDGTGYGGIAVDYADKITVTGNILVSNSGPTDKTPLQIFNSSHVTITNNQAISIGTDGDTDLILSGNVINVAVKDAGVAALNAWGLLHPESSVQVALVIPAAQIIAPTLPVISVTPVIPAAPMQIFVPHLDMNFFQTGWAVEL